MTGIGFQREEGDYMLFIEFIGEPTLQSCIDLHEVGNISSVLNDGKLIGFKKEEIPTQTVNPSGDE